MSFKSSEEMKITISRPHDENENKSRSKCKVRNEDRGHNIETRRRMKSEPA